MTRRVGAAQIIGSAREVAKALPQCAFLIALLVGVVAVSSACHEEVEFTFDNRTDALLCFDSSAKDASEAECSAEVRPLKKTTWVPGCGYGTEADKIPLTVVLTVKEGGRQIYQRTEECRIWQKSSRKFIIEQRGEDFVVTDPLTGTTPSP
jgi:hypothetical protein